MEPQAISSDLIRGHIDTIILHSLLDSDKFAQQISDAVESKSHGEYKLNQATLYSSLKRLENLKHVVSYWNDSDGGRRKFFKLTESGKNTVATNLNNWSYSRSIIDKLMDCAPVTSLEPQIQVVEKIVEVEKVVEVEKIVEIPVAQINENSSEPSPIQSQNVLTPEISTKAEEVCENSQDINFRSILGKLVHPVTSRECVEEQLEQLPQIDFVSENKVEVQKFNETLDSIDYNAERNNNGKIDFGDLTLKAAKEGYKLKISSKDSFIGNKTLLINKVNLITSTIMFLISSIVFFAFKMLFANHINIDSTITLISMLCLITPAFINSIIYVIKPYKTTNKQPSTDTIFVSLIVAFNLILITFVGNLLYGVDFSKIELILLSMVSPVLVILLVVIHFVVKLLVAKSKKCKITKKQLDKK